MYWYFPRTIPLKMFKHVQYTYTNSIKHFSLCWVAGDGTKIEVEYVQSIFAISYADGWRFE